MTRPDVEVMRDLLARVKAATGPDRTLDGEIMFRLFAVPVGNDVGYVWPEDNPSWNFGLTRNQPVSQQSKDLSARDARREGGVPKEWIEFQREDGRWVLMNDLRIPKLTGSTDAAAALIERVLPGFYAATEPWFYIDGKRVTHRGYAIRPRWADWTPHGDWFDRFEAEAATSTLSILAALLTALIAAEGRDHG